MRLALALCVLTTGAAAEGCPTSADLETGIRLSQDSGGLTVLTRRVGEELRVEAQNAVGEDVETVVVFYSHPLAMAQRTDQPGGVEAVYANQTSGLDFIQSARVWVSDFQFLESGDVSAEGTHTVQLTGLGDVVFGDCSYTAWRIQSEIAFEDGSRFKSEQVFAPDLGILVGETQFDSRGNVMFVHSFDQITAE